MKQAQEPTLQVDVGRSPSQVSHPVVCVGLPVYNGEKYLAEAIDSILAQTFSDWELIISDNASDDRTEAICREYVARDDRIRYHRNGENIGLYPNFTKTLSLGRGKYFVWRAADDLCSSTFLEESVAALEANPDAILAYPRAAAVDSSGRVLHRYDWLEKDRFASPDPKVRFRRLFEEFSRGREVGQPAVTSETEASVQGLDLMVLASPTPPIYIFSLFRREVVQERLRPEGSHMRADETFLCQMSLWGTFCEIPNELSFIRIHTEAASYLAVSWDLEALQKIQDPTTSRGIKLFVATHWLHVELVLSVIHSKVGLVKKASLLQYLAGFTLGHAWRSFARAIPGKWNRSRKETSSHSGVPTESS